MKKKILYGSVMKTNVLYICATALVLFSCKDNLIIQEGSKGGFQAAITQYDTKTSLSESVKTLWSENDEIGVYSGGWKWFKTSDNNTAVASFSGDALDPGVYPCLYPYHYQATVSTISTTTTITTWISESQVLVGNNFGSQKPILYGKSDTDNNIAFQNVASVVKFKVPADTWPSTVYFIPTNGENVAGSFQITDDNGTVSATSAGDYPKNAIKLTTTDGDGYFNPANTYYFTVAPQTFAKGIRVAWSNPAGWNYYGALFSTETEKVFGKNKIINLGTLYNACTSDNTAPSPVYCWSSIDDSSTSAGTSFSIGVEATDETALHYIALSIRDTNNSNNPIAYKLGTSDITDYYYDFDNWAGRKHAIIVYNVTVNTAGTYYAAVEAYDMKGNHVGDWGNHTFTITAP